MFFYRIQKTELLLIWNSQVGGNLPVDSAIFLEFLPGTHQYLLTVLSIWWAFGQLLGSLVAWPIISNYSCQTTATTCARKDNMVGWIHIFFYAGIDVMHIGMEVLPDCHGWAHDRPLDNPFLRL